MSHRFSTEDQRQSLKTMWRVMLRRLGTLDDIAEWMTRLSKPCLSKAGNALEDYYAPVDAVLDLELALGDPLLTRALAKVQGFRLVNMDASGPVNLMAATAQHAALLGEWSQSVIRAMADGHVSAAERERLIEDIRAMAAHCALLHDSLALGDGKVADIRKARGEGHGG